MSVLALSLAVAGCTQTLDKSALERNISEGINAQLALPIKSTECPADREIKAGDTFQCTAIPEPGGRLTIDVKQDDDAGNVTWSVAKTEGLLDLQKAEAAVREGLKEQVGVEAKVECGQRWRAATPGDVFQCRAATADQEVAVQVTVDDAAGNITWAVQ